MRERGAWARGTAGVIHLTVLAVCLLAVRTSEAILLPEALKRAEAEYSLCRSNYVASPGEREKALSLAAASFRLADISTDDQERARVAEQGIAAARTASEGSGTNAAAQYYLGLNLGALARTKKLGALSLLRQMEHALTVAAELDPGIDHAGPDRSLGQLYLEAPGWPTSVGSRKKARECFERCVKLDPGYPDNRLSFMEGLVRWKDGEALRVNMREYEASLPVARQNFQGPAWAQAWSDWDERWRAVENEARKF